MRKDPLLQVKALFDEVYDLAPAERVRFLEAHYPPDAEPRRTLERLLQHEPKMGAFLETPLLASLAPLFSDMGPTALSSSHLGPYRLERELGRGGMGVVYLAVRDDDVFRKQVAIKLVWPGLSQMVERFRQERQMLADLEHPHIARLLDGGATAQGWQYLVMEYVEGLSLTEYCQQKNVSLRARLELFLSVCAAVQHAHQRLIIHRDLKPGNILVTAEGEVKLLDFGIAKALDTSAYSSDLSLPGTHLMTPEYASPEQLTSAPVTTASDVYSLGVVLFELLTGQRPYQFASRQPHEAARVLRQQVLPQMSQIIGRGDKLAKMLRGDLDNIVGRTLQPQANERYASVAQLSDDLRRHLNGEVVQARRPTWIYRANRFIRRHKAAFAAGTIVLALLGIWLAFFLRQVREERIQARDQRRHLYAAQMKQTALDWQEGNLEQIRATLKAYQPQHDEEDLRGFEWYYLWQLLNDERWSLEFPSSIGSLAITPDSKVIGIGLTDGTVILHDTDTGRPLTTLGKHQAGVRCLVFSADGKFLVTGDNSGMIKLWDVFARKELFQVDADHNKRIFAVTFSPNGQTFATASESMAKLWNASTGQEVITLQGHKSWVRAVRFSRDGRTLFTGSNDGTVRVWNTTSGQQRSLLTGYGNEVLSLGLTPDEKYLAVGGLEREVKLFELATGKVIRTFAGHTDWAWTIALSPDGKIIAATGPDQTARLWETATGRELAVVKAHDYQMWLVAFTPDGHRLITGDPKKIKLWEVDKLLRPRTFSPPGQCYIEKIAFSADSKSLAAGESNQGKQCRPLPHLSVWDIATGKQKFQVKEQGIFSGLAFIPHQELLAVGKVTGVAEVWDLISGQKKVDFLAHTGPHYRGGPINTEEVHALAVAPNGQMIATGDIRKTVKLWTPEGQEIRALRGPGKVNEKLVQGVFALDFSHDSRRLALGGDDVGVEIFEVATGQKLLTLSPHNDPVRTAKFSPDDRWIATAGEEHLVRIWDAMNGHLLKTFKGHADIINEIAWTPDGKRVASASKDKTVRMWDVSTGLEVFTFRGHTAEVRSIVFSPDGRMFASGSRDGTVRIWRAAREAASKK